MIEIDILYEKKKRGQIVLFIRITLPRTDPLELVKHDMLLRRYR